MAYHLGARSATAQAGTVAVGFGVNISGSGFPNYAVMTSNGDVFVGNGQGDTPVRMGNFWGSGGPTATTPRTMGQLRARYR